MVSGERKVLVWWACLSALAAVNIALWTIVAANSDHSLGIAQAVLSGLYVFGCAYRSFLPVYDIPRRGVHGGVGGTRRREGDGHQDRLPRDRHGGR